MSDKMDRFAQLFYIYLNADVATDPSALDNQRAALRTLVELLARGLAEADASFERTGCSLRVPGGEAKVIIPDDYVVSLSLYRDAFRALARLYSLPVEPWLLSYTKDPLPPETLEALVVDLDVLVHAMEATPNLNPGTTFYNLLLCAFRLAGQGEAAEQLYLRMQAGHKGPGAKPDLESATQLFKLYMEARPAPNIQGMWRVAQLVVSCPHLSTHYTVVHPALVGRLLSSTLMVAAHRGNMQVASQVLALASQQYIPPFAMLPAAEAAGAAAPAQGVVLGVQPVVELLTEAARADEFALVQQAWQYMQQAHSSVHLSEGLHLELLQAAARAEDTEAGASLATQVFAVLERDLEHSRQRLQQPAGGGTSGTPAAPTSGPTSTSPAPQLHRPSAASYQAYVHVLGRAQRWQAAFIAVADLEAAHGTTQPPVLSPFHGLAPLALALAASPGAITAAYQALVTWQLSNERSVSSRLMDVVLRAVALGGLPEAAGRLLEEYAPAGLEHTADSYHAVMEACAVSAQPAMAASVMQFMQSKGFKPSSDTHDLLIRAHLAAGDLDSARLALLDLRRGGAGVRARLPTMKRARQLAAQLAKSEAELEFASEVSFLEEVACLEPAKL